MARVLSKAVMRWWPDEMVPQYRPAAAVGEARRLWESAQLYEPFDITGQVAAKYGEHLRRTKHHRHTETLSHRSPCSSTRDLGSHVFLAPGHVGQRATAVTGTHHGRLWHQLLSEVHPRCSSCCLLVGIRRLTEAVRFKP